MVRLKSLYADIDIPEYNAFQFLMVRLKANCKYVVLADNSISIPYGAIKRQYEWEIELARLKFQFLMVRLKVCNIYIINKGQINFNSLWCD